MLKSKNVKLQSVAVFILWSFNYFHYDWFFSSPPQFRISVLDALSRVLLNFYSKYGDALMLEFRFVSILGIVANLRVDL